MDAAGRLVLQQQKELQKLYSKNSWQAQYMLEIAPGTLPNLDDTFSKPALMEKTKRVCNSALGMSSTNLGDGKTIGGTFPYAEAIARTFPAEQLTNGDLAKNGRLVRNTIVKARAEAKKFTLYVQTKREKEWTDKIRSGTVPQTPVSNSLSSRSFTADLDAELIKTPVKPARMSECPGTVAGRRDRPDKYYDDILPGRAEFPPAPTEPNEESAKFIKESMDIAARRAVAMKIIMTFYGQYRTTLRALQVYPEETAMKSSLSG